MCKFSPQVALTIYIFSVFLYFFSPWTIFPRPYHQNPRRTAVFPPERRPQKRKKRRWMNFLLLFL